MSRVTISVMTRWLLALLVSVFVAGGVHDAEAQAFKKKSKSAPAAKKTTVQKPSAKKAPVAAKKKKAAKAEPEEMASDEDAVEDKPAPKDKKGKKTKVAPPEEADDYVLIEDDEEA